MKAAVLALVVASGLWGIAGHAQDRTGPATAAADTDVATAPRLRVDFPESETIPGQFLTLRLTVLVPTFMPTPPVWPGFEAPNLLVRVPEGGTSPISERIDGATWSGVSRRYLIAPMVPGEFGIAPQDIVVTRADPDAANPSRSVLSTGPLAFSGVVPAGAETLDPFVAAKDVALTQEITGNPDAMVPGDSVTRSVTVTVTGLSPMFLPALLDPVALPGVAAYPDAPQLDETADRGVVTGTRRESITYVAESGGGGTLPAVTLDWFDIDTGETVTATVAPVMIAVDGPPARIADPEARRRVVARLAVGLALVALLGWVLRRAIPPLRARAAERRAAHRLSEAYAWRTLEQVLAQRDHGALHPALDTWSARVRGSDPRRDAAVQAALIDLGRARYGAPDAQQARQGDPWQDLATGLRAARRRGTVRARGSALPPLNPGATA